MNPLSLKATAFLIACALGLSACSSSGNSALQSMLSASNHLSNATNHLSNATTTVSPPTFQASHSANEVKTFIENSTSKKQELSASTLKVTSVHFDGKTAGIDFAKLPGGLHTIQQKAYATATVNNAEHQGVYTDKIVAYKQPHSVVIGDIGGVNFQTLNINKRHHTFNDIRFTGKATAQLPKQGVYQYAGVVFDKDSNKGNLNYSIDFAKQTGQGTAKIGNHTMTLHQGDIDELDIAAITDHNNQMPNIGFQGWAITSQVSSNMGNGNYMLGIMGDNAEELAGHMSVEDNLYGLAGKTNK